MIVFTTTLPIPRYEVSHSWLFLDNIVTLAVRLNFNYSTILSVPPLYHVQDFQRFLHNHLQLYTMAPKTNDARFARLQTDPRFRRPNKKTTTVEIDDRFKDVLESEEFGGKGKGKGKGKASEGGKLSGL